MRFNSFKYLLTILLFPLFLNAQIKDQFVDDFNGSVDLGCDLTKAIFSSENLPYYIGGAALIAGSMYFFDEPVRDYSQSHQNEFMDGLFGIDKYYGGIYTPIALITLYSAGLFSENQTIREVGLRTSQAYIYTGILAALTKEIFGRARPLTNEGSRSFSPFAFKGENYRSFFSGHTSLTFSISTVLAAEIDNIYWKIGWYGLAAVVGGARIYHDKHWFSDVITGAVIGYAIGRFVVNNSGKYTTNLGAGVNNGGYQLNFTINLN
jgi:membrane-associated phospholipid phosphatase